MGCPNDCTFCNQRLISGSEGYITPEEVHKIVEERKDTVDFENDDVEIAFFGGSFTMIPIETQEELLSAAYIYVEAGLIKNIRISTRPDGIDSKVVERILRYKVTIVELGVQSMDESVLNAVKRGYKPQRVVEAIKLLKDNGLKVGVQIMIGLPKSNITTEISTVTELIKLKPEYARIYPTLVIEGTELAKSYLSGDYTPLNLQEATDTAYKLFKIFDEANVEVIRIGLQPTDKISNSETSSVIAGPEHPSMGELVFSKLYMEIIENGLKQIFSKLSILPAESKNFIKSKDCLETKDRILYIRCNPSVISMISGHKSENKKHLFDKYGFKNIKIISDLSQNIENIEINYCNIRIISSKIDLYQFG